MLDLVAEFKPDVVLMGVGTLHSDHLRAVEQLHSLYPESKILMVGACAEDPLPLESLKKSVRGRPVGIARRGDCGLDAFRQFL